MIFQLPFFYLLFTFFGIYFCWILNYVIEIYYWHTSYTHPELFLKFEKDVTSIPPFKNTTGLVCFIEILVTLIFVWFVFKLAYAGFFNSFLLNLVIRLHSTNMYIVGCFYVLCKNPIIRIKSMSNKTPFTVKNYY